MTHMRLAAVVASAAVLVPAAMAGATWAPPEFGRCVKYAKGQSGSGYDNATCTGKSTTGARFHWLAGPGPKPGFTASTGSVALSQWSGIIGQKSKGPALTCSASRTAGEFAGASSETLELTLAGCAMGSTGCQSAGAAAGEVRFTPLEGLLVVSKHEYWGEALVRWSPAIGDVLADFDCGATEVSIEGAILHTIRRDKMRDSEAESLKVGREGVQKPSCYEGAPCGEGGYQTPTASIGGAGDLFSGLSATGTQTDEESIEAVTRQELP